MKGLLVGFLLLASAGAMHAGAARAAEGGLCGAAIQAAQDQHAIPAGWLFAIGQVESGRPDQLTHRLVPWPWTVGAENQSYYFATKADAVAWVEAAQARNILSIDVGCMQVNLMYHPDAFRSLDAAFDPRVNADYAAHFLVSLHAETGDWHKAAGLYHSQTLALAVPYAEKVEEALTGRLRDGAAPAAQPPTMLALLQSAWGATLDGAAAAQPASDPAATAVAAVNALPAPSPSRHLRRARFDRAPILLSYEH